MILVNNFRKVILLLCLFTRWIPGSTAGLPFYECWQVDKANGFRYINSCHNINRETCGINITTGYGMGCVPRGRCPSGIYGENDVVCGKDSDICCCDSKPGNGIDEFYTPCNFMYSNDVQQEACSKPELRRSYWCRPNLICAKGFSDYGENITCDMTPGLMPYCRISVHGDGGYGQGCASIEFGNDYCPEGGYVGSEVVCKDEKCCCRGNEKEPCNILSKQVCQLPEFKDKPSCIKKFPPPTTATTDSPSKQEPSESPTGCNNDYGCDYGSCLLATHWLVIGIMIIPMMM